MKILLRIVVILLVIGFIGGEAALIIKATDPGPAAAPASQSSNNGKVLNREQPSQGASGQAKQGGSSGFSVKQTLDNLGKMALIILGVWSVEKVAKNQRRSKPSPSVAAARQQPRLPVPRGLKTLLPRPNFDFYSKWDETPAQGD